MAASGSGADRNAPGLKVAVESILQRKIKEITYEGEEIYEEYINSSYLLRSTFMVDVFFVHVEERDHLRYSLVWLTGSISVTMKKMDLLRRGTLLKSGHGRQCTQN